MKRLLLLLALVISVVVTAAPALADGDFYVVAVGGGVGTKITSLPYEIKNPGFYYLSGNLTYSGENYAIWIAANNVTLDLMGFSLTSNVAEAQGIEIHPYRSNVEIRNGTVNGFYNGINAFLGSGTPPHNHRIINIRAFGNNHDGIRLEGNNHLVKGCDASYNGGSGILLGSGIVTGCTASYNGAIGIRLVGEGNIIGNVALRNSSYNFFFGNFTGTDIMVDQNTAAGLTPNYYVAPGTTGIYWGINSGKN